MKLVTKFTIFGLFAILLVIILGLTIYWRSYRVDHALDKNKIAQDVVRHAFTLNILSNDYTQTRGERAERQWRSQFKKLNSSIDLYTVESVEEQQIADELKKEQAAILTHFSKLQDGIKRQSSTPLSQEAQRRLVGQLSVDMQNIVSLTSALATSNSARLTSIIETTSLILFTVLLFLGTLLILTYAHLARSISGSILKLTTGTKILAGGNLDFQFDNKNRDEFGQLAIAFNEMTIKLKELDQAKEDFIRLASHELRTPTGAIRGFVSMILDGDYGMVDEKLKRPLASIRSSNDRQLYLINSLLDASRIRTGKIKFAYSNFSLKQITGEIVEFLQPLAKQKDVKLSIEDNQEISVYSDVEWVKQILNNLIGNALKFTNAGSVLISYHQHPDFVDVIITDTGIGISDENQKKLFTKLEQFSSQETGKPDGMGLGLYISREIARHMGGDVSLSKSKLGQGSEFVFTIAKTNEKN